MGRTGEYAPPCHRLQHAYANVGVGYLTMLLPAEATAHGEQVGGRSCR